MRTLDDASSVPPPAGPPGLGAIAGELRGALQLSRLGLAAPRLLGAPRGDGQTVIDLPGWKAPEASNAPLRAFLRRLGYDARPWGLGTNRGTPEADARALTATLEADPEGPKVALVGWSLGGTIAREVARNVPERVACVVTFGSPVVGGPTHTLGAHSFGEEECRRAEALIRELDEGNPIRVPITAIFTKHDGVVDWRACVDHTSADVRHVEVGSTHLSLGLDPDVWSTVAESLHRHLSAD